MMSNESNERLKIYTHHKKQQVVYFHQNKKDDDQRKERCHAKPMMSNEANERLKTVFHKWLIKQIIPIHSGCATY